MTRNWISNSTQLSENETARRQYTSEAKAYGITVLQRVKQDANKIQHPLSVDVIDEIDELLAAELHRQAKDFSGRGLPLSED